MTEPLPYSVFPSVEWDNESAASGLLGEVRVTMHEALGRAPGTLEC